MILMNPSPAILSDHQEITRLRSHLEQNPRDGVAWLNLAQNLLHLLRQNGMSASSKLDVLQQLHHAAEQAITCLPESTEAWLIMARMQARNRGKEAASRWLEQISQQNPSLVAPQLALSRLAFPADNSEAIIRVQKICEQAPDHHEAQLQLADFCLQAGLFPDAIQAATAALSGDDRSMAALMVRADASRLSGRWKNALNDYEKMESLLAMQQQSPAPALLVNAGSCLASLERYAEAREKFAAALKLDPTLSQADLNLALLIAYENNVAGKPNIEEAIQQIDRVLDSGKPDQATRHSAQVIRELLEEQLRLQPALDSARCDHLAELQAAIISTPAHLAQADSRTVRNLESIASLCREHAFDELVGLNSTDTEMIALVEACVQCKQVVNDTFLTRLWEKPGILENRSSPSAEERQVASAWSTIKLRASHSPDDLSGEYGEACLRFWQAQILRRSPEKNPGQLKAIANAIGARYLTPPERVAGTFRHLLQEIRPKVPAGPARALFMYIAINQIHGFVDGNGRLSRFLLAWESGKCDTGPLLVPAGFRDQAAASMDSAWFDDDLKPLVKTLRGCQAEVGALLTQFRSIIAGQ